MDSATAKSEPFGRFAPRGWVRFWILLARHTPLGRGRYRHRTWRRIGGDSGCFDLSVRGQRMRLYGDPTNLLDRKLIMRPDRLLPEEIGFLRRFFSPASAENPMTYIDVGANVGALTLPIAANRQVRVIAVEPDPRTHPRLAFNVEINGLDNVRLEQVALSDREGEVDFICDSRDARYSGIDGRCAEGEAIRVPCISLAGLAEKHGFDRIDAMKIDVEGHEDAILLPFLDSCPESLWPRVVIIEAIEREGLPDCIGRMRELGYQERFKTRSNLCLERA